MILHITFLAFLLIFGSSDASTPRVDPLVNTNLGLIRGVRASDGDYAMFMGIPYAKVNASNPFGVSSFLLKKLNYLKKEVLFHNYIQFVLFVYRNTIIVFHLCIKIN